MSSKNPQDAAQNAVTASLRRKSFHSVALNETIWWQFEYLSSHAAEWSSLERRSSGLMTPFWLWPLSTTGLTQVYSHHLDTGEHSFDG